MSVADYLAMTQRYIDVLQYKTANTGASLHLHLATHYICLTTPYTFTVYLGVCLKSLAASTEPVTVWESSLYLLFKSLCVCLLAFIINQRMFFLVSRSL